MFSSTRWSSFLFHHFMPVPLPEGGNSSLLFFREWRFFEIRGCIAKTKRLSDFSFGCSLSACLDLPSYLYNPLDLFWVMQTPSRLRSGVPPLATRFRVTLPSSFEKLLFFPSRPFPQSPLFQQ